MHKQVHAAVSSIMDTVAVEKLVEQEWSLDAAVAFVKLTK